MTPDDIIKLAREAGFIINDENPMTYSLERFAALVAAAERNKLAAWMIQFGFATGHGDTMEQLVDALGSEIVDRIECEIGTEREACAKVCEANAEACNNNSMLRDVLAGNSAAIRARSNDAA